MIEEWILILGVWYKSFSNQSHLIPFTGFFHLYAEHCHSKPSDGRFSKVAMVQLRTRQVRLPVPTQRQLDSARKILSSYEEQGL